MKKIYLTTAALLSCVLMQAQAFWTSTSYKGAFPVTDNSPATDWTDGWANWDPENTNYAATTTTVSADVTSNTTWSGVVCLVNKIYVKNNAVLTIQPGTIIRGDKASQGSLIITKGAQIQAAGTALNPIVFTSNESVGNRAEGDWGGVILLGKGLNNQPGGVANIEGITAIPETEFGGTDDNDNSGVFTFVRIEFAGIPLQPNKEINGLTFGSVGKSTTIHHIQVSFSGDDSFEWFGGAVDAKYLISYRCVDDDFDTDFGYKGRVQFGLSVRDKDLSDAAGDSNSFESDNDATGSFAQPRTQPVFSNMTLVGPKGNGGITLPIGEKFEKAFRLRRNTATSCYNSLIVGWEKGLSIEAATTEDNFSGDTARFESNILTNFTAGSNVVTASAAFYTPLFGPRGNDSTTTIAQINWVNAFPALGSKPDLRLNAASTASAGATFTSAAFTGGFINGFSEIAGSSFEMVELFPNPSSASTILFIGARDNDAVEVRLTDVTGKTVVLLNQNLQMGENFIPLSMEQVNTGLYFVTISGKTGKQTLKLVVSH